MCVCVCVCISVFHLHLFSCLMITSNFPAITQCIILTHTVSSPFFVDSASLHQPTGSTA